MQRTPFILGLLCAVAAATLLVYPTLGGFEPAVGRGAGAVILGIGLWATRVVPEYLGAIMFFFAAVVFAVSPPAVVFAGFHSGALWLVFGGLVLGTAAQRTGLGDRVAELTGRHLPSSYTGILAVLMWIGLLLAFFIPSGIGRLALLVPFVASLAERLGFPRGSRGYVGLVLGTGMATISPANTILTANVPPIVLAGAAESIFDLRISYLKYLLLNLPVLGLGSLAVTLVIITCLFRDRPRTLAGDSARGTWTVSQRRLLLVMLAAIALWMTDFLHGIAPAWVAMAAAIVCLLPRSGILVPRDMVTGIDFAPWFFIAGVVGLGAVATDSGFGDWIGNALLAHLELTVGDDAVNYAVITLMGLAVGLVTTIGALPAIMTPLAGNLVPATGWGVESVLMVQVSALVFFPLPYQVPPVILMMTMGGIAHGPVIRLLWWHLLLGALLVVPLHYHWARWLGYVG